MKKILLLGLFFLCFSLSAQTVIIRTSDYAVKTTEDWSEWEAASLLIAIDENTIKIDNQLEEIFYIRSAEKTKTGVDENGNYTRHILLCFDKNGVGCYFMWKFWHDIDVILCEILYLDISYTYLGNKIN